jgi:flagellum-specific ATP synthase
MFNADHYLAQIDRMDSLRSHGRVGRVIGTVIEGTLPDCSIGQLCEIESSSNDEPLLAEVVGFHADRVMIMPLGEMRGLKQGCPIRSLGHCPTIGVGEELLGRVLDGLGNPIDGLPRPFSTDHYPVYSPPVNAFERRRISEPLDLGCRAINGLLTCGIGQRIGIMAGSGVGKSTLLGMMARQTRAQVNVIALVGERGRELKEFIERDLGPEGLARSVVVAATSDRSPLERVRAAFVATAIAEIFRDQGRDVLLMMDSVTRFAMAQREIGLSVGEPPTTKGYTPSVFSLLPRLLERAGMGGEGMGSITGLYTVLVDGDDMNEPIADAVRSILDGHIVLSRELADQGHYPAIDVLASKSRLMTEIVPSEHVKCSVALQGLIAAHRKAETLINIGAYMKGSNPMVDRAIAMHEPLENFLKQGTNEPAPLEEVVRSLYQLALQADSGPAPSSHSASQASLAASNTSRVARPPVR